jgi:hypothetical protein
MFYSLASFDFSSTSNHSKNEQKNTYFTGVHDVISRNGAFVF